MHFSRKRFGVLHEREIDLYTIDNENGVVVSLTNFGGIITSIRTPDIQGKYTNIALCYGSLEDYVKDHAYIGCIVGRYANRINKGVYFVDGQRYQLHCNDGPNHLHGGRQGYNKKIWESEPVREKRGCGVKLSVTSPDGEEGYPGTVDVQVLYLLTPGNELIVDYVAATDMRTVINLTQHSYFNLAGSGTILDHLVRINGSGYTPVDENLIPTGAVDTVDGTIYDLRDEKRIEHLFMEAEEGALIDGGFDHNFVLDSNGDLSRTAASLYHPESGRLLEIYTTKPGMQFYTANHLDEEMIGHGGKPFCRHGAVCLETQFFPDSPNQSAFPSVVLEPGHVYKQITKYRFGLRH